MSAWTRSLRLRVGVITLITLSLALVAAHWWLSEQFSKHLTRQFDQALSWQLDQVTARLVFDETGQPSVPAGALSDPRWNKPYSGLYWQIDRLDVGLEGRQGVLRSRSLWDGSLSLEVDALTDHDMHAHADTGPNGETLRVLERTLKSDASPGQAWRIMVASDTRSLTTAQDEFRGVLAASLMGLGLLLAGAGWAQWSVGLAPLRRLQNAVDAVRQGASRQLEGDFASEVQPLVDDFNQVIRQHDNLLERARAQAGNLAHALKTPLAVIGNAVKSGHVEPTAALIREQLAVAERQIGWHMARARAAGSLRTPGQYTPLGPLLQGLMKAMEKLHADRHIQIQVEGMEVRPCFAGEEQDLREMLGNLLDNAFLSARRTVWVNVVMQADHVQITIADDGKGIAPDQQQMVLERGTRLDESRPGNGLGLAIVQELATLYEGELRLGEREGGGLSATLTLPATRDS